MVTEIEDQLLIPDPMVIKPKGSCCCYFGELGRQHNVRENGANRNPDSAFLFDFYTPNGLICTVLRNEHLLRLDGRIGRLRGGTARRFASKANTMYASFYCFASKKAVT